MDLFDLILLPLDLLDALPLVGDVVSFLADLTRSIRAELRP